MLASIEKRVGNWAQMQPFYSDIPSGAGKGGRVSITPNPY